MSDDKKEPEAISEEDLKDVTGGRRTTPTTVTGKFEKDILSAEFSSNDTIIGRVGEDTKNFNIGMPPMKK